MSSTEYVLGTSDEELARLGLQHRLWGALTYAAWERGGFGPGQHLLDVGCGPGFASFDLAALVGPSGRVIAVDESPRFLDHLRQQISARGVTNVEPRQRDVHELDLPEQSIDAAYARWVFCFVRNPRAVVRGVSAALRPGATFVIHDYFQYKAVSLAPRSDIFDQIVRAVEQRWRDSGGNPDVAAHLPRMLSDDGLRVREIRGVLRAARPGEPLWSWPTSFFRSFVPALAQAGYITPQQAADFAREWAQRSADPHSFFSTPPMYEIIAEKPK